MALGNSRHSLCHRRRASRAPPAKPGVAVLAARYKGPVQSSNGRAVCAAACSWEPQGFSNVSCAAILGTGRAPLEAPVKHVSLQDRAQAQASTVN